MNSPLVSIIIATKNEEGNIENCLKSILCQTYPRDKIEIIVVDNNSADNTKKISQKYADKIFNKGPERSAQRNFGAKQAKGEYYLYLDADMILSQDVIAECVKKFKKWDLKTGNSKLAALYIPEIVTGNNFWSKVRRFERNFYNATVIDCVRFVKMKNFLAVGGFDETMSGPEDWDFDKKIRNLAKADIIKSIIYHNEGKFNLGKYLRKKKYYAKNFDIYINKWGGNDADVKKQFGLWYRYCGVFIEDEKWKKLLAHPILTIGTYFLRGLVGMQYLIKKK